MLNAMAGYVLAQWPQFVGIGILVAAVVVGRPSRWLLATAALVWLALLVYWAATLLREPGPRFFWDDLGIAAGQTALPLLAALGPALWLSAEPGAAEPSRVRPRSLGRS